jgi:UDP-N-acetylmuramoyl-L-alanyl-D-glutamate--2,6-diaminopimelate ligase
MTLKELLTDLEYDVLDAEGHLVPKKTLTGDELLQREIKDITNDSRKAGEGVLFFAVKGARSDGHDFIHQVRAQGAAAVLVEHMDWMNQKAASGENPNAAKQDAQRNEENDKGQAVYIRVTSTRYAMALVSAAFYGHPARRMKMIGITGTKGKTTTTYLVRSILQRAGMDMGLIGTIESTWHEIHRPAANTTPESLTLQRTLREMADDGVEAVVMEVSSQALKLDRTAGITFDIGVFTNLSEDHIGPNEHDSFEDYLHCKSLLFRQCRLGIVNGDDPHAAKILEGSSCRVLRYGMQKKNDLYAENLKLIEKPGELGISFDAKGLMEVSCEVPTPGRFSVYNALSAISICHEFGVTGEDVARALLGAKAKGRIELVRVSDSFTLMIDYAHNAVALESLLSTLREYHPHRLVTLFGCGGNRSRSRRFEMGEVSGRLSDLTIITSDNPRDEEPMDIIADIVTGISGTNGRYVTIPDRKEAIAYAIHNGEPGDIVVLAGKGHEDYQEIKGVKYPMDERNLIAEILEEDRHGKDASICTGCH